jgi:hypothetical protein
MMTRYTFRVWSLEFAGFAGGDRRLLSIISHQ